MSKPPPFDIVTAPNGLRVASNGALRMTLAEADGRMFRRRGVKGLATSAPAEQILPLLNAFAGEIVADPAMSAGTVVARLMALAGTVHIAEPQHVEWAVAEIGDVRVYVGGNDVVVTRRDLTP